ncbi:Sensor protein KdpD [Aquicella siphonis]|uniref:histidine kinase n=1 Tax=Aquicella siphonis TaxID=254247 RepID=A0A5E4PLT0_9COXI|nr:sensor histidine kinase KdpD [Aquicella siphonis]VVC77212.1 Sensor protein KdpD [Aquicella siphonis]
MIQDRPNPETLLRRVQDEERQERRGKLKIYLGAAPGVGKTYTMLQDALARRSQGLDVLVGIVESHGRKEIESLLDKLEVLPRLAVDYHGRQLHEFDLDGALKRNPGLILIDEMAHTNVPGSRHAKRWQDIKEILDRGIDVYTTLNVQHVETLNDVVSQIIHTRIKETVPDAMLEMADTIELVDLPPEDLLKRLQEGKVYFPKQAELAAENFFRKGNLTALRELALRVTAERVGAQVLLYRQGQGIKHIWPTREKILVCVGTRVESAKLIRAARRMATKLQADWIAVHVDTPRVRLSEEESFQAMQNLRLAEKLGAETRILTGFDVVKEIMDFAREQNITLIMVWKHIRSRLRDLLFRSLADELTRRSGEIDIYTVTSETRDDKILEAFAPASRSRQDKIPWRVYGISFATVILATLINSTLYAGIDVVNLIMVYLLGVTFVALFGQVGPSVMASVLSVLAYDFFFIPPYDSFVITDIQYFFTLMVMLLVTQVISHLAVRTRQQVEVVRLVQHETAVLHTLSRQLASTRGIDKLLGIAVRYIGEVFDCEVLALMPENDRLGIRVGYGMEPVLSTKEQGVAQWVYDLGQIAGLGTDTLPFSDALYVPLLASQSVIGVLRIRPTETGRLFTSDQVHLLESCANQIALALEVDRIQEQAKKTELQSETDRVRLALLQSVTHDLRTPLVAVMGSASTLMEIGDELDAGAIKKLASDIYFEVEQFSRLINNLLQMTYLEAESVVLQIEPHALSDVIHAVVKSLSKKIGKKPVHIKLPADMPAVPFDNTLIQEVFINLLDNAIKFTPPESPIEISVVLEKERVLVSVEDHGPGIVFDEVNKLFEKFYRGRLLTTERGLGLGLAICYRIIKAHGGEIWAENRPDGGAVFRFTLPLESKKK